MPHNVVHFDIHCDDVERARRFYSEVFGWQFRAWGPPDFYMIQTGPEPETGIHGSLSKRARPLKTDESRGFECTISVDALDAIAAAIEQHGGKLVLGETEITGVGRLIQFEDTEGNHVCAMKYETHV